VIDPAGYVISFTYALDGNREQQFDADGYLTAYEYDAFGRRTSEIRDSGGLNLTTARDYDENNDPIIYETERQEIFTGEYDRYSNALNQTIELYDSTGGLIEFKTIVNTFDILTEPLAAKKGNATHTTIVKYLSFTGSGIDAVGQDKVERQEIDNTEFDLRGNIVRQDILTYVVDLDSVEKLATQQLINGDQTLEITFSAGQYWRPTSSSAGIGRLALTF